MTKTSVHRRKLVVVGDGACGKTSLLFVLTKGEMPTDYIPTVFDNYVADMTVKNKKHVQLSLFDTAGQEDYDQLRKLMYIDSSVVLICYNIANPDSLINVAEHWASEVRQHCPGVPIILCGNKQDLRKSDNYERVLLSSVPKFVSTEEGRATAVKIGANEFFECSAWNKKGVSEMFDTAAALSVKKKSKLMLLKAKSVPCAVM